jgi:hypothetical protein
MRTKKKSAAELERELADRKRQLAERNRRLAELDEQLAAKTQYRDHLVDLLRAAGYTGPWKPPPPGNGHKQ